MSISKSIAVAYGFSIVIVSSLAGTCGDGGSLIEGPPAGELVGRRFGTALAAFRAEDQSNAKTKHRDQPLPARNCPISGTRTPQEDGSMTFDACEVFPGFTVNGNVNRISTGDDEQSFRLELNNVTGGDSDSSFFINGTFEETVGDDGSLTFVADINSSSTLDDETDITNVVGTLTVAANGDMSGGFALPKRCRNTLDCATACDLTGFNIFTLLASPDGFEAAFQEACEQSISIDCGPGQIPFLLINGGNEPAHILAPEETQSDATLLQPGGSRPVCVPFAQGQVVNFRLFTESGGFALRACAHTEFPTIFPLEGQIQFLDEPFGLYCNGTVFD